MGSIPGLGRSSGEGNGNLLQYSCLKKPIDRGAWWAMVLVDTQGQTLLSTHTHTKTELPHLCFSLGYYNKIIDCVAYKQQKFSQSEKLEVQDQGGSVVG